MSVMLFKLDSHGFDEPWLAKLRDSFDVTLHMEVIFRMELINPPVSLGDRQRLSQSHHVSVDSISTFTHRRR